MTDLPAIESRALSGLPHVAHAFFTRQGGVSKGLYAALNTGAGSGDVRADVIENRARCARHLALAPDRLVSVHQIHSATVHVVTEPWAIGQGPQGDAMVTAERSLALGVLAADCTPVLFADRTNTVVGAAHAGWKGALGGVLEATLDAMEKLGAARASIVAAIGPTISKNAYEVGPEFEARFRAQDAGSAAFFAPAARADHFMFDLPGYVEARLTRAGCGAIDPLALCTYGDEPRFFSYRRTTHRGESDYGRNLSAIALR